MRVAHTFIDQLEYFAGKDSLNKLLPLWYTDLRVSNGSWSPAPIFERMKLTKAEVLIFCNHMHAYTFADLCVAFASNFRRPGGQLLSSLEAEHLRERYNLSKEKSKHFGYFIEALYGAVRDIPSDILDLARTKDSEEQQCRLVV